MRLALVLSLSLATGPVAAETLGEARAKHVAEDRARIRAHLTRVEAELRAAPVDALTDAQRANRLRLLDELHAYRESGAFPQNWRYDETTPIFIDEGDRFCAVGHLLKQDGQEPLARTVSRTQNLARVPDITAPALLAWAGESGFTVAELTRIQPSYAPPYFCNGECIAGSCDVDGNDPCLQDDVYTVCDDDGVMYANACVAASCGQTDVSYDRCPEASGGTDSRPGGLFACSQAGATPLWLALGAFAGARVRRRRHRSGD